MATNRRVFRGKSRCTRYTCLCGLLAFALMNLMPNAYAQSPKPGTDGDIGLDIARKSRAGLTVDAGEFYRVGGRKIRLLRSLEKVAVRHVPDRGEATRKRLESSPSGMARGLKVDRELPGERMLIVRTQDIFTLDGLFETIDKLRLEPDISQAVPIYVNAESGLEMIPTEQFVVKLEAQFTVEDLAVLNDLMGVVLVRPLRGTTDQFILSLPDCPPEELLDVIELYNEHPGIDWAEPDFLCQVVQYAHTPTDSYYLQQWHLNNTGQSGGTYDADIDAPEAWDITTGSSQIVIAIMDDGMDMAHEDLIANLASNPDEIADDGVDNDLNGYVDDLNGWDFYDGDNDPSHTGSDNHGTLVAGAAAAKGDNNKGVAGVAYGCKLMPLRDSTSELMRPTSSAEAIRYASGFAKNRIDRWRGADVINISSGFDESSIISLALQDAAQKGRNGKGCPIFCATGNEANDGWERIALSGIPSGTYTFKWEYKKDSSVTDGDDTVWLDSVVFPGGEQQMFDSAGLPAGWSTGGNADWHTVQEGQGDNHAMTGMEGHNSRSVRSGSVGNNGYSWIQVTKTVAAGSLVFSCWPSCEADYDGLRLYINGNPQSSGDLIASGVPVAWTNIAYPASHSDTIAVGASTDFDYRADYSCYGAALDFVAPGGRGSGGIYTTDRSDDSGELAGNYDADFIGTSASSPVAAGVAALMLSVNPDLTAQQIREIMRSTCDKIDSVPYTNGRNDFYGHGRINANLAVKAADAANSTNAVYHVGNDALFSSYSNHSPNYLLGFAIDIPLATTLQGFGAIVRSGGSGFQFALYNDVEGDPGALVASAPVGVLADGRNEVPMGPVRLSPGRYWLMAIYDSTTSVGQDRSLNTTIKYIPLTFGANLPAFFQNPESYTGYSHNYYIIVQDAADSTNTVFFADPNLKAAVETALGVSDPTPSDMLGLTVLAPRNAGIQDLTGLEHAANLSSFHPTDNEIVDLSPLQGLTAMRSLGLSSNNIVDISPLGELTALYFIYLPSNDIVDISPLEGLTLLENLCLRSNNIADLSALTNMGKLTRLDVTYNPLSWTAINVQIPQIIANNPGIELLASE